jgi:hypothetical protein
MQGLAAIEGLGWRVEERRCGGSGVAFGGFDGGEVGGVPF